MIYAYGSCATFPSKKQEGRAATAHALPLISSNECLSRLHHIHATHSRMSTGAVHCGFFLRLIVDHTLCGEYESGD